MTADIKIAIQGGNGRVGSVIAQGLKQFYDVIAEDVIVPEPGIFAVINAAPYHTSVRLAEAAVNVGAHYLDMTEDVGVARHLKRMASTAKTAIIPQCGLAPGLVSVMAGEMVKKYDKLKSLNLRVGGLPRFPINMLNYALTWNVEGLINQYSAPATAIRGGELVHIPALGDVETLHLENGVYEAFNTSGGVGTLCDSFPEADEIDYKTIRYPGHANLMKFLLQDLAIGKDELRSVFERAIPSTDQDVVLISVTSSGWKNSHLSQATYSKVVFGIPGRSALQMTTATSVCAVVDMLATGALNRTGFVKQEEIPLDLFIKNRFGKLFA